MRIRATATAATVSGALVLGAFAVPAAQAAGHADNGHAGRTHELVQRVADAKSSAARTAAKAAPTAAPQAAPKALSRATTAKDDTGEPYPLDVSFSKLTVNKGKAIVLGTKDILVPLTFTLNHNAKVNVFAKDFYLDVTAYHGSYGDPSAFLFLADTPVCKKVTTTSATCTAKFDVWDEDVQNSDAGTAWKVDATAVALNGVNIDKPDADFSKVGLHENTNAGKVSLLRASKLTTNAAPEPVKKGKTLTVTGALTRANWETKKYAGYTKQSVKLQYLKKGAKTWSTLKTLKTDGKGNLKTTVKAGADGYYRYSFAGTSTTPAVTSTSDYVDVK